MPAAVFFKVSWQQQRTTVPNEDPPTQAQAPTPPPGMSPDTPPASSAGPVSPKPRRRWLRVAILVLALVAILLGVVSFMTRPARLVRVVESLLEDSIGCEAQIGQAQLTWSGVLTVDGIDLSIPGMTGESARLLHSDRVVVQLRFLPLLIGRVRAASVALTQPTLYLTEDLDDGLFNYEHLIAGPPDQQQRGGLPKALPELFLSGGQMRFGQVTAGVYQPVEGFDFDGTLTADDGRAGGYTFVLNQHAAGDAQTDSSPGPSIQGEIDLSEPRVEFQVDHFTFTGPHRYLLPQEMRLWWDRLSPKGALPEVIFSARQDEAGLVALTAQMRLDGIGLLLPIQEGEPLRLADVTGLVILSEGVVELKGMSGELEGITFTASGRVEGFESQSPLSIAVSTEPFDIPAEGGIWPKLPQQIRRYQERFSPQGRYQAQVTIDRPTPGSSLQFSGHMDLLDTRFKYNKFPYPADQLSGRVTFNNQRVDLNDLVGISPSGGRAIVSGSIIPPGGDGKVDITIRGEGFAVDDYLLDAMKPKHRKIIDMFFNREGYEDLLAHGVIRAPGEQPSPLPPPPDASDIPDTLQVSQATEALATPDSQEQHVAVPVFEPGGTASMVVHIQRPAGPGKKYRVTTDLDAAGLRSVFSFWHYPMLVDSGRVVITPDDVRVDGVHLRSVSGGGGGVVDGRLELPNDEHKLIPFLQLSSIRLPIDEVLVASIPKPKDRWVKSLNLTGALVGTGEVYAGADGKVSFTIDSQMKDGTATPNGGTYTLEDIQGFITVEHGRVQFEQLTGRHDGGTITLDGQTDFSEQGFGADLKFIGGDLRIEPGLIDLLPTGHDGRAVMSSLFDKYSPEGEFDGELDYFGGNGRPDGFMLSIEPKTLSLDYAGQRIELADMFGRAELTPKRVVLYEVGGRFASGKFKVNGDALLGEEREASLTFDVDAQRIDATARAVLPGAVLTIIDKLSIQGPYRMDGARLLTWPTVKQGPTMIFEGKVRLLGASAQVGVPVTELDADLDMHVVTFSDQPWPHTDIRIDANRLRAADRLIERVSLTAQTGKQPWQIELADLRGTLYGGTLVGWGQLRMGKDATFGFDLTLQEVELEPFLNPLNIAESTDSGEIDPAELSTRNMASGLLSAGLTIRIPTDDPSQRQGRGVVTVRDAKLYDRPITLALLQAANLGLPNESSFDRASARYLIFGDTVQFDDIRFEAPAFVIAGTGTMDFPSNELNLRMVTHNPAAPDLGPVSELVRTFKDELLGIEVRGTLAEPKARVVTLEGFFRSWGRVFGDTRAQLTHDQPAELQPGRE